MASVRFLLPDETTSIYLLCLINYYIYYDKENYKGFDLNCTFTFQSYKGSICLHLAVQNYIPVATLYYSVLIGLPFPQVLRVGTENDRRMF